MLLAMHMPDHTLSPAVTLAATAAALVAAGATAWFARRSQAQGRADLNSAGLFAAVVALVFAGQMVNYAIPGAGVSGHLLGAALAAILLGPARATGAMTIVLAVQCLFFNDGGLTALGANVLNMALVGIWSGYAAYRFVNRGAELLSTKLAGAAAAGMVSVLAAATVCSLELALSGDSVAAGAVFGLMLLYHSAIGAVEALLTAGVVAAFSVLQARGVSPRATAAAGFAAAIVVALTLAPAASSLPDGLEATLEQVGMNAPVR